MVKKVGLDVEFHMRNYRHMKKKCIILSNIICGILKIFTKLLLFDSGGRVASSTVSFAFRWWAFVVSFDMLLTSVGLGCRCFDV